MDNNYAGATGFAKPTFAERFTSWFTAAQDYPVKGVDVSHWQGDIDWNKMASMGIKFAFIRAGSANSLGAYKDSRFDEYMLGAKAAGIKRGCYWYFKPAYHQLAQGQMFAELYNQYEPELFPVLDVEDYGGLSPATLSRHTRWILDVVDDAAGECGVYTAPGWWNSHVEAHADFKLYPLWVAHWGVSEPRVPRDWSSWLFWQTHVGSDGREYGVSSQGLDHDVFFGTLEDFEFMFGNGQPPEPPPAECPKVVKTVVYFDDGSEVECEAWLH